MSKNFWEKLNKPFFVLAPMADVTDIAYREIIARYGKPDVMFTEFVSADGLFLGGREALIKDLAFTVQEKPIVVQFFTSKPRLMKEAAILAQELGFDGIDINMGCPDKGVEKQGCGASLIRNPVLATELINAAKEGSGGLPVSVKTRIGYNKDELDEWLPVLLKADPSLITIHARTRKQMSKAPADWNAVKRVVEIRNSMSSSTLICGNGDVADVKDARKKAKESGADGIMFGRAVFGNPWLFDEKKVVIPVEERLNILMEHTNLFEEVIPHKNFSIMKKHFKAYLHGWPSVGGRPGAKELRMKLMETKNAREVEKIVNDYLSAKQ